MALNYDQFASSYAQYRQPDPRLATAIHAHLRSARRVINVGAGMGAYEPGHCEIVAVEPSAEMIAARKLRTQNTRLSLTQGVAEDLAFADNSFDGGMAILTIHHWTDLARGLAELRRVTRGPVVILSWIGYGSEFWLEDYLPEIRAIEEAAFPDLEQIRRLLDASAAGEFAVEELPIPHDCTDGFMGAYWRRPHAYLKPEVRAAISTFARFSGYEDGLARLASDLASGQWQARYARFMERSELDLGYRLVVHRSK